MDKKYFKETFHFSNDNTTPLYEQLASYFRIQIQAEEFKPEDKILPEEELCDILSISRTTVRQALDQLVSEGLIIRYRGKGSFIANPKMKRPINHLYNFTENMYALGATPKSIVLNCGIDNADSFIREKLKLPKHQTQSFHLTRLRCANEEAVLLEDTYIPYYLCENIESVDFNINSLYHTLANRYSLNLCHATETIEAIHISKSDSELLRCKSKSLGYKITRTSHLDSGFIFEFTTSITRADKCMFQLELYKNNTPSKSPVDFQRHVNL